MESIRKAGMATAAVLTAMLSACASLSGPNMAQKDRFKLVSLSITQVGADKTARYVYCDVITCPGPTKKTMAQETAVSLASPMRVIPPVAAAPLRNDAQVLNWRKSLRALTTSLDCPAIPASVDKL